MISNRNYLRIIFITISLFVIDSCDDELKPFENAKTPYFQILLEESIKNNDVMRVDSLIKTWSASEIDTLSIGFKNAMQYAVHYKSIPVIEYLLHRGASYHGIPAEKPVDCSCSENVDLCKKANSKSDNKTDSIQNLVLNSPACEVTRFWKIKDNFEVGVNAYVVLQFVKYGFGNNIELVSDECNPIISAISVDNIDLIKRLTSYKHNFSDTYGISIPYVQLATSLKMLEVIDRSDLDLIYKQSNDSLYKYEFSTRRKFIQKLNEPKYY